MLTKVTDAAAVLPKMTLVEAEFPLAPEVAPPLRWRLLHELRESGVVVTGEDPEKVECDSRFSTLRAPQAHDLGGGVEVHSIGDCDAPGNVETAFEAAGRVARTL